VAATAIAAQAACAARGCPGLPVAGTDRCFAHSGDRQRAVFLRRIRRARSVSGLARTSLTADDVQLFLDQLRDADGRLNAQFIDLSQARIDGSLRVTEGAAGSLYLTLAEISGDLVLEDIALSELACMNTHVGGDLQIGRLRVAGRADIVDAVISGDLTGRDNSCTGEFNLIATRIRGAIRFELSGGQLDLGSARLEGGGDIRFSGSACNLRFADISEPTLISSSGFSSMPEGAGLGVVSPPPRILSLESANVAGLTLAGMDLTSCRFAGSHNLHSARFEDTCVFAQTPSGWALSGGRLRLPVRCSRRRIIAEEIDLRNLDGRNRAWARLRAEPAPVIQISAGRSPAEIAALYRSLRKGREDARDEPGAADFYYGEMEMRRQRPRARPPAPGAPTAERLIVGAYWLASGYSLRAWRAFAWLLALIMGSSAVIAAQWPGAVRKAAPDSPAWIGSAWIALKAIILHSTQTSSIGLSRFLMFLALSGPILFALWLLAIRGRVKR
jgi:hypothetical protein